MASLIYNNAKKLLISGDIDLVVDTIKVLLIANLSYMPDKDLHDFLNDVTNEVPNGNGYTTEGQALANKAVAQDDINDRAVFTADDNVWPNATFTARAAIIYKYTGVASASPLIAYIDFGADKSASAGNFQIDWKSYADGGILLLA